MFTTHFVTYPERLTIQAPGIARLGFSIDEAVQPAAVEGKQPEPKRVPVADLVMPVESLLQLHTMLSKALAELQAKGLLRRADAATAAAKS